MTLRIPLTVLIAFCLGCQPPTSPSPPVTTPTTPTVNPPVSTAGTTEAVEFPAFGLKLRPPEGMIRAKKFEGFGDEESGASLIITTIPGPFEKSIEGFSQTSMAQRGWTLHSREDFRLGDFSAMRIAFDQPAGGSTFKKWGVFFGDAQRTTLVLAMVSEAAADAWGERFQNSLRSLEVIPRVELAPGSDVPFTLTASSKLKLTPGINKMLLYTKEGKVPAASPTDPLLIAAQSLGAKVVGDPRTFAEQRLGQTARLKDLAIQSTEPLTIAELAGMESHATAADIKTGAPMSLYQLMLFADDGYILIQGMVGTELKDEYYDDLQTMARSFQWKLESP